jgi:hypothetical protein
MRKSVFILSVGIACMVCLHCEKEIVKSDGNGLVKIDEIGGCVQKGPYIDGSVTLYELSDAFIPTGSIFDSRISDNSGSFAFSNLTLISPYIKLKADGFYFDEVRGKNSSAPMTLYALTDLSNLEKIHINLLTHLEKDRVEYLLSQGKFFSDAKAQAEKEVLEIFEIIKPDIAKSECLDILEDGDDNAILLSISLILQGYRTVGELGELSSNISQDIREDGTLDDMRNGSALITDAVLLDLPLIRTKLEERYPSSDTSSTIPDFELYVENFIQNTDYKITSKIEYLATTDYGENVLDTLKTDFVSGEYYSLAANLPIGTTLKIKLEYLNGPEAGIGHYWECVIAPAYPIGWMLSNCSARSQVFEASAKDDEKTCKLMLIFMNTTGQNQYKIEYYENDALKPTRIKIIMVE